MDCQPSCIELASSSRRRTSSSSVDLMACQAELPIEDLVASHKGEPNFGAGSGLALLAEPASASEGPLENSAAPSDRLSGSGPKTGPPRLAVGESRPD